jgi:hypothetical protein
MFWDGHLLHLPFGFHTTYLTYINHRVAEVFAGKVVAVTFHLLAIGLTNLSTEDSHILLVGKFQAILHKDEVTYLFEFHDDIIRHVTFYEATLHNRWQGQSIVYIASLKDPTQRLVEPTGELKRVVIVNRCASLFRVTQFC